MTEIKVNNEPQKAHNGNNMPWRQEFDPFADLFGFPVIPIPARRGAKPARAMEAKRTLLASKAPRPKAMVTISPAHSTVSTLTGRNTSSIRSAA